MCYYSILANIDCGDLHDVGSKYHKLLAWDNHCQFNVERFICWRPNLFSYDLDYNDKHASKFANLKSIKVINETFNAQQVATGSSVTVNDCIWYDGVFENMLKALDNDCNVYFSNFIYQ
jgi:hypothetical protein